ncbi:hypothetical protein [Pacificoceanicola onchidii]|uniref:hypothetical protein n=1 Tax=Pacificoceanicola onchidii TaxID=2562685 RepID=UPI0010A6810C|nr:hypothetical protein [Pacificoceanicola onchidii]
MDYQKAALLGFMIVSVSACDQAPSMFEASRGDTAFLVEPVAVNSARERAVTQDVIALEDGIRAILQNAQAHSEGCGGNLSDPAMVHCSERDLMGRTLGAVRALVGSEQSFDRNALAPAITQTLDDMTSIEIGINAMLNEQSEEMDLLEAERLTGQLSEQQHALRLSHMQQSRIAVAEALGLSAKRARNTRATLEKAGASEGTDYSWYIQSMIDIESRALSARDRLGLS